MKTAVVLFNLGGPDGPDSVRPFLFNLFADPAIIRLPAILRLPIAWLIAKRRHKPAIDNYAKMGGGSPLLPNTTAQAEALQAALGPDSRVFIAMRYWHPMSDEVALQVKDWGAERVILLPLYPQWSTTTSASSLTVWRKAAKAAKLEVPTRLVCCYPTEPGFISAYADLALPALEAASAHGTPRLLLSAHGLPEKIVTAGDPYQAQCEASAAALTDAIKARFGKPFETVLCYQSRVGPLKWIGPATEDEVRRGGADKVPLVVLPLAFVSDHIETLVEIGEEYRHLGAETGVPHYERVPAVAVADSFIAGLARLVREAAAAPGPLCPDGGKRICAGQWSGCAFDGSH